jgi:hypothetical protein
VNLNAKEKFTIDPKEFTIDGKKANGEFCSASEW